MRARLKGVYRNRKKTAAGGNKDYWFLRGTGPIKPLEGDEDQAFAPGTPAFMRAYNEVIGAPRKAKVSGTLQRIINEYQASQAWASLAERTKADYGKHIAAIEVKWGFHTFEFITDPLVRSRFLSWRDDLAKASPRQADACMAVLRVILEFGRDRGLIAHNHAIRPKKVYRSDRSEKLWLPPQIAEFRAVAPAEVLLAFELALGTGQRKGDLLRLPWTAYDGKRLRFRQGKRKRLVDMPVTRALKATLDAAPKKATTILSIGDKPWSINAKGSCPHFDHQWRKAIVAAGLDGLHFHDLRGTTCTQLAEAGATPSEIAAMLGWTVTTVNQMLDTYQARTAALSDSAVAKLEARA